MVAASTKIIKETLDNKNNTELKELVNKLIKFKKENKELASYILFYENEEHEFVADAKTAIQTQFEEVNTKTVFYAKKGLRKMLRIAAKFCKYSSEKTTTVDLGIFTASLLMTLPIHLKTSTLIKNMYSSNLKKINTTLQTLHEDIQFDYNQQIKSLAENI